MNGLCMFYPKEELFDNIICLTLRRVLILWVLRELYRSNTHALRSIDKDEPQNLSFAPHVLGHGLLGPTEGSL